MELLSRELEKLVSYTGNRDIVEREDIDSICTTQISSRIFVMIDELANGKVENALHLYKDLLSNREKPLSILFLISRHFNILLQIKESEKLHMDNKTIASLLKIPPFSVRKYKSQAYNFTETQLKALLETCLSLETDIKSGNIEEQLAVELLLTCYIPLIKF